jgi:hypothetical protein
MPDNLPEPTGAEVTCRETNCENANTVRKRLKALSALNYTSEIEQKKRVCCGTN